MRRYTPGRAGAGAEVCDGRADGAGWGDEPISGGAAASTTPVKSAPGCTRAWRTITIISGLGVGGIAGEAALKVSAGMNT